MAVGWDGMDWITTQTRGWDQEDRRRMTWPSFPPVAKSRPELKEATLKMASSWSLDSRMIRPVDRSTTLKKPSQHPAARKDPERRVEQRTGLESVMVLTEEVDESGVQSRMVLSKEDETMVLESGRRESE